MGLMREVEMGRAGVALRRVKGRGRAGSLPRLGHRALCSACVGLGETQRCGCSAFLPYTSSRTQTLHRKPEQREQAGLTCHQTVQHRFCVSRSSVDSRHTAAVGSGSGGLTISGDVDDHTGSEVSLPGPRSCLHF